MAKAAETNTTESKTKRKSFSEADKAKAVRLVNEQGYTQKLAAAEVGCSTLSLIKWLKEARKGEVRKKFDAIDREVKAEVLAEYNARKTKKATRVKKTAKKTSNRKKVTKKVSHKSRPSFGEIAKEYWSTVDVRHITPEQMQAQTNALVFVFNKMS